MAEALMIGCPECGKQFKVPATIVGKKVRCKACGEVIPVSASAPVAPPDKAAPKKDAKDHAVPRLPKVGAADSDATGTPYGLTDTHLSARCPECAADMEEGGIICLKCGYNTMTRIRASLTKTVDITSMDQFLWLLPGILCVLLIILLIVWDILHIAKSDDWFDKEGALAIVSHGSFKVWNVVISLAIIFFAGKFAIKRLILHPRAPEMEIK
jgi:DNA-directed RNA polymerase subunit RPC12/RpoP